MNWDMDYPSYDPIAGPYLADWEIQEYSDILIEAIEAWLREE